MVIIVAKKSDIYEEVESFSVIPELISAHKLSRIKIQ